MYASFRGNRRSYLIFARTNLSNFANFAKLNTLGAENFANFVQIRESLRRKNVYTGSIRESLCTRNFSIFLQTCWLLLHLPLIMR